ncbi:hypothetical protein BMF94_7073 [Rhodotorula taiwanensis]|uniref:F-box domain-containing protein n=1 Tax=Rhodotorula taiwanensis TaxID=741276 RepID=A0A2S5AZW0_9BASI|nr:hypothetical protein BMF94_7073 [Rhodotorula taiwanensis]
MAGNHNARKLQVRPPTPPGLDSRPHRSRLRHLRSRLSATYSASAPVSDADEPAEVEGAVRRPRLRHRFSHSLTSLVSPRSDSDQDASGNEGGGQLARWRARSKAKLAQAFLPPSGFASSPPCAAQEATSPALLDAIMPTANSSIVRSASRNRSHSAPLLVTRATELVLPMSESHPMNVLAAPLATRPARPLRDPTETPIASPYYTCPSSPWLDQLQQQPEDDPFAAALAAETVPTDPQARPSVDVFSALPYELQLAVFRSLLEVCEGDWVRAIDAGQWTSDAARHRWSDGRAGGRRELVKIGRVSRLWRQLSMDSQLWPSVPAATLLGSNSLRRDGIDTLLRFAGAFATALDARGLGSWLDWKALGTLVDVAAVHGRGSTRLVSIDLTGCTALTATALSTLLSHSPLLRTLLVPGVRCVNDGHMRVLGSGCAELSVLDASRCACLPASSLLHLPYPPPQSSSASQDRECVQPRRGLRSLKASGLSGMNDFIVSTLLERHANLHTLDVSFSRLQDDSMKALVSVPSSENVAAVPNREPSQAGTASSRRRFPRLKHLVLSGCTALTSVGLGHLEGALPELEILEVARLGARARTDGLARLIASCPRLRKVDLEDDCEIGDDVLRALLPNPSSADASRLEHLNVSGCTALTDEALGRLVAGCTRLRALEADGTAMSDRTARTFINLAKDRAAAAQATASSRKQSDPLIDERYPAFLSILDNRTTGRRLSRDMGVGHRPRHGRRGHWTTVVPGYHDPGLTETDATATPATSLRECDQDRVVVRSFHSSLAVDVADAMRAARAVEEDGTSVAVSRSIQPRLRSLSDSEIFRRSGGAAHYHNDSASMGCVIA